MDVLRQALAVGLVFGLLAAALWALRRRGLAQWGKVRGIRKVRSRLEALDRLPLSPQQALHLVRVGGRALLIAAGSGGCRLIESLPLSAIEQPRAPRRPEAGPSGEEDS